MTTTSLTYRILSAVPARLYDMAGFLALMAIEESHDIPTAMVTCEARPRLLVNPDFVAEHCGTDERLLMLVLHELHHVLLGHTRLFPRGGLAHNIAFDAVINAHLHVRFPEAAYREFFDGLYAARNDALRLLAPPGLVRCERADLDALHQQLYAAGATAEEIFHRITDALATGSGTGDELAGAPQLADLLGHHGDEGDWGTDGPAAAEFVGAIRGIVEKWPPPNSPVRGRSLADVLRREHITRLSPAVAVRRAVEDALRKAARPAFGTRQLGPSRVMAQVALPSPGDRRGMTLRAAGGTPLLWTAPVPHRRARREGAAEVYLDVSGSMAPWVPYLYGALSGLGHLVMPRVHLFSTAVATVPLGELHRGVVLSTGGTEIACVLEHLLEHRSQRALVITDGYTGAPRPADRSALAKAGIECCLLLTPNGWRTDLLPIAAAIAELPILGASHA